MNINPTIKNYFVIQLGDYYVIQDISKCNRVTHLPDFLSARPADVRDNMFFEDYKDALDYINNVNSSNELFMKHVVGNRSESQLSIGQVQFLDYGEGLPTLVYNGGRGGWSVKYGGAGL